MCFFAHLQFSLCIQWRRLLNCCYRNSLRCGSWPVYLLNCFTKDLLWHWNNLFPRSWKTAAKLKLAGHLLHTFNSCNCINWLTVLSVFQINEPVQIVSTFVEALLICRRLFFFFFLLGLEWLTHSPTTLAFNVSVCVRACFEIGLQTCVDCLFSVLHLPPLPLLDVSPLLNSQTDQEHSCSLHHVVFRQCFYIEFSPVYLYQF